MLQSLLPKPILPLLEKVQVLRRAEAETNYWFQKIHRFPAANAIRENDEELEHRPDDDGGNEDIGYLSEINRPSSRTWPPQQDEGGEADHGIGPNALNLSTQRVLPPIWKGIYVSPPSREFAMWAGERQTL